MQPARQDSTTAANDWIACLTYKSVATASPGAGDLQMLVNRARARNRSLGITGMLAFENDCFLQTLEGPPAQVDLLWSSIKQDTRHSNIDILSEHVVTSRLFSNWDLLIDERFLDSSEAISPAPPAVAAHISQLVDLALNGDDIRLNGLIAGFADQGWTGDALVSLLIEPAARALGDAWMDDACSAIELTIALSMLQLAGHAVRYAPASEMIRTSRYSILLATAPRESHMLGTSLLADQFTDAGWQVEMAFPESEQALLNQLDAQQPDAMDIALSDALPRQHALVNLRSAIEHSRMAAMGRPTILSVGGRLFAEASATASSVGADYARKGIAGSIIPIAELVQQNRQRKP
jgi:blue light- and temperature-responsive anti-repressor